MATIDPAGAASSALYTPAVPVKTPPQATTTVSDRPVEESNEPQAANDAVTQAAGNESRMGRFVDTTA